MIKGRHYIILAKFGTFIGTYSKCRAWGDKDSLRRSGAVRHWFTDWFAYDQRKGWWCGQDNSCESTDILEVEPINKDTMERIIILVKGVHKERSAYRNRNG